MLRDAWEKEKCENESVASHLLQMRERFEQMSQTVKENLEAAQKLQKRWYDQNARQRQFQPGDQVLVLLPTSTNKLLAQWQGPYEVVKKIGKVAYLMHVYDCRKKRRVFHVNMLKQWYIPTDTGYSAEEVSPDYADEDIPVWKESDESGSSQAHVATVLQLYW